MQLHEIFSEISGKLVNAVVDQNLPAYAFVRSERLNSLTNEFITMVKDTGMDVTPEQSAGFPSLRTALVQLNDATNLWKDDAQTVYYMQKAAKELGAFLK